MGYSAVLETLGGEEIGHIVDYGESEDLKTGELDMRFIAVQYDWFDTFLINLEDDGKFKIKGFLYAGQLAGKDEIPEGQRFRLRSRGLIGIYASTWDKKLRIKFNEFDEMYYASREEVEPVFD